MLLYAGRSKSKGGETMESIEARRDYQKSLNTTRRIISRRGHGPKNSGLFASIAAQNSEVGILAEAKRVSRSVDPGEVRTFLRQCSLRANSGIPILEAVAITTKETLNPALSRVFGKVQKDLADGQTLSVAFSRHPEVFPDLLIRYTTAGEESGCIERVWTWFADQQQLWEIRESSFRYVMIVGIIASLTVMGLLLFVLPQFSEIFSGMRVELPFPTMVMLQLSSWVVQGWYAVVPAVFYGPIFLWRKRHNRLFMAIRRSALDGLPWLKSVVRKSGFARLARILVLLLESGIPVASAVEMAASSSGNPTIERSAVTLRRKVASGMRLSMAMEAAGILPSKAVAERIYLAEDEGLLLPVLEEIARDFDREGNETFELFRRLIEPVVIIIMGCVIGGIVLPVFMPMTGLVNCAE